MACKALTARRLHDRSVERSTWSNLALFRTVTCPDRHAILGNIAAQGHPEELTLGRQSGRADPGSGRTVFVGNIDVDARLIACTKPTSEGQEFRGIDAGGGDAGTDLCGITTYPFEDKST